MCFRTQRRQKPPSLYFAKSFVKLMTARRGVSAAELRTGLVGLGVKLKASPSYSQDIQKLEEYSDRVRAHLESYEKTAVDRFEAQINRSCTDALLQSVDLTSLLLVGEPGAGKSAVVIAAAARLRKLGRIVIELAVDRLQVGTLDGLRMELELSHSLVSVLRNWPGDELRSCSSMHLMPREGTKARACFDR